jgi:hypothetical protein
VQCVRTTFVYVYIGNKQVYTQMYNHLQEFTFIGTVEYWNQRAEAWVFIRILTPVKQTIDWIRRATNFPYFLHNEFGGFTARKLLD